MSDFAVETRGLSKCFGSTVAVADLSLAIPRGEIFGFLGQNGAGKTTSVLTGRELLRFHGRLYGRRGPWLERRIDELLDVVRAPGAVASFVDFFMTQTATVSGR